MYNSYEAHSPFARSDFLKLFLERATPLLGQESGNIRVKYEKVLQQEPMLNECGLHVVNNLCSLLFYPATFSRVDNVLVRKTISRSWWPRGPGIPLPPERTTNSEETLGEVSVENVSEDDSDSDSDCSIIVNLVNDLNFEDESVNS